MILFFYGPETFRSGQKIKELKDRFLAKNTTGSGFVDFDCASECSVQSIMEALGAQNLFAEKKLVIIKDFFAATKADEQKELRGGIENGVEDVVVFWERSMPRKNNAFFKWLVEHADQKQECAELSGAKLFTWAQKQLRVISSDATIVQEALDALLIAVGNDLHLIDVELRKLVNYAAGRQIVAEDVYLLVHAKVDADIFATIDAVAAGDKKGALTLVRKHLAKGDEPFYLFSMYVYQVRILLSVGSFFWAGTHDRFTIAKQAKLHPFVVQKALSALRHFSQERLMQAYATLAQYDKEVKVGKRDIVSALELFVVRLDG